MANTIGRFERRGSYWNVYDIHDTCSDMPHASAAAGSTTVSLAATAGPAERQAGWWCGSKAATTAYMNHLEVRAALGINASEGAWAMETDLDWNCSNDDEAAFASNFTTCQITDYRPMLDELVRLRGVPVLVYSGDIDAQIPHIATERWTRGMGYSLVEGWQPWAHGDLVGGYVTRYVHNFTFATVKGAGHMAPLHRSAAVQSMVRNFVQRQLVQ